MTDEWEKIRAQVKDVLESKDIQDIELIKVKVENIHANIVTFFEESIADFSLDEKALIKIQGESLVKDLAEIMDFLQAKRKQQSTEAYKMSQGKKALSAYKNT